MWKTLKNLTGDYSYLQLHGPMTSEDGPQLFAAIKFILGGVIAFVVGPTIVLCLIGDDLIEHPLLQATAVRWASWFENTSANYQYFESVKSTLGIRYALSYGLNLFVVATGITAFILVLAVASKAQMRKLTWEQIRICAWNLLILAMLCAALFHADFVPTPGRRTSFWQRLFSTEWAILTTSALFLGLMIMSITLIFALVKYALFRGKIEND
jgi:hypothetical protein